MNDNIYGQFSRFKTQEALIEFLQKNKLEYPLRVKIEPEKNVRTLTQNKAIHQYYTMLADELNASGNDMRVVIKEGISIEWNPDTVKKYLWKPVQKALIGHEQTSKLKTDEVSTIYQALSQTLAERCYATTAFPSRFG